MIGRLALALVAVAVATPADAKPKKRKRPSKASQKWISRPDAPADTPAYRYGRMSREDCIAELASRGVPFVEETVARGVYAPVRITGPLRGVTFRTNQSDERRATSSWEIADCRLALALDDFAEILTRHGIVDVRHYSMYRAPRGAWPDDKIGTRHDGAVAIDAARFITADGSHLDVLDHFSGRIDAKACDGKGPREKTPQSIALRELLCDVVDAHIFNIVLTPNFNRAHRNHFHMELTGAEWFLLH